MQLKSTLCVAVLAGAAVVGVAMTTQKAEALSVNQVAAAITANSSAKPPMGVSHGPSGSFRSFNSYNSWNSYRSFNGFNSYRSFNGYNSYRSFNGYNSYRSYYGYGWYSGYRGYNSYNSYRSYYGYGWYSGYRGYGVSMPSGSSHDCGDMEFRAGPMAK